MSWLAVIDTFRVVLLHSVSDCFYLGFSCLGHLLPLIMLAVQARWCIHTTAQKVEHCACTDSFADVPNSAHIDVQVWTEQQARCLMSRMTFRKL